MADSTTNISLTKPAATDSTKIREDFNNNMDIIDGRFSSTYLAVQSKASVDIDGGSITGITDLAVADGGTGSSTASDARTALGLAIGTNVQAYDAGLLSIAGLSTAANKIIYTTASDTYAVADLTAFARTILDDDDASTARATLGLAIGTNIQAYDAGLLSIAGLTTGTNSLIYTSALDTYAVLDVNATATNKFLRTVSSGAPSWEVLEAGDVPDLSGTYQASDASLTSISGLTYASASFIKLTAEDTYAVRTLTETKQDLDVDDLENVTNALDSASLVTGGVINTTEADAGTFNVTAITEAYLRTSASATAQLEKVTLDAQSNVAITAADTTYFVVLTYGSPCTISVSATAPNMWNAIGIGKVMKEADDTVHFISGGYRLSDGVGALHKRARTLRNLELASGSAIAYSGTNNFTIEEGVIYGGINRITASSYNSADTQFTYLYDDGTHSAWTKALSNVIDYAHYDDLDGTLGNVANNKYSCHWVYRHVDDGDVYVIYGRGSYTLAEAEVAEEPPKPDHLTDFGLLIGCIIAPQAGGSFTEIQMVTDTFFTGTSVGDHSQLSNLQGGTAAEYYHLTSAQHTIATQAATTDVSGYLSTTDWDTFNNKANADQTFYIGTTQVAINRGSGALTLAGITLTTPDIGTPSAGILTNCTFPTLNQNTTGTAANLSGTPALPDGTTCTTQTGADNSTKLASTAYVDSAVGAAGGGDVTKVGNPADSQVGVWTGDGTIEGAASLTYDGSNFQLTGDIGATASRITKGWFTDLEVTNAIAGSITGNAATFTCTDNEEENLNCPIVFVDGATGAQGAETDGDLHYNPSTGTVTATAFVGDASGMSGVSTDINSLDADTLADADEFVFYDVTGSHNNKITWTNLMGSITKVGTITTGVWQGTDVGPEHGGTGVSNGANNTITFTGNYTLGVTLSDNTTVTLPTSGTLVTTDVATLSSLTSVGTIATGTWEATDIGIAHGGTGVSTGAMTNFTSILNTSLYVGRDADNQIKFATDNNIVFRLSGSDGALFNANGELDMNANSIGFTQQSTTGDGTTTIDWKLGNKFYFTFGAQADTFTFTAPTNPGNLLLVLKQDGTGSRTATWPETVMWPSGTAPTLSTGASEIDIISFYYDGTNYFGVASLDFSVPA